MNFSLVDEYTYLYWAKTVPLPQYLSQAFDPRLQGLNYRPFRRVFIFAEYSLFHSADPGYYHFIQLLIHIANSFLVFGVVWYFSKKWQLGLVSAILFAGFPPMSEAVFWIADESPLTTFFSLLSVLFWASYLQNGNRRAHTLAVGALVLALLSKESAVIMPFVLFLIDRLLVRKPVKAIELVRRYFPITCTFLIYLTLEFVVQMQGIYLNEGGYSFGQHVFSNYAAYFAMLAVPWKPPSLLGYATSTIVGLLIIATAIVKRSMVLTFLLPTLVLAIGPVVLTPLGVYGRYLYLAAIPWVIILALIVDQLRIFLHFSWSGMVVAIMVACVVTSNGFTIMNATATYSEIARQRRVPFHDIMQQHPTMQVDTRLFLIEPPYNVPIPDIAGMLAFHYGKNISVGGTYEDGRPFTVGRLKAERANLRDYSTAYVYYFDETNRPIEIPVVKSIKVQSVPQLPVDFTVPIRLEGFEVTNSTFRKGKPLALILYWRATGRIDKDYTVFVHLVDSTGQMVAGVDSMPRSGKERTSQWKEDQFTADAHIITVPESVPTGMGYRIEVGLYYLPTMQRLSILDAYGHVSSAKVTIAPFEVME